MVLALSHNITVLVELTIACLSMVMFCVPSGAGPSHNHLANRRGCSLYPHHDWWEWNLWGKVVFIYSV